MQPGPNTILRVLDPGFGASVQDRGRNGWRRFGVPISGAMDSHSAECANRLLENDSSAPVLELLLQGAKFEVLHDGWVALCGATVQSTIPNWRAHHAHAGDIISLQACKAGVWSYLAVEGGFAEARCFGSASHYARGGIGRKIERGTLLDRPYSRRFTLLPGVSGREASWEDRRDYDQLPRIRVWMGPQWNNFSAASHELLFAENWKVSPRSDRVGYRLEGTALSANPAELPSEPVRLGSIQVPESGEPIITMRDGPTVGGYPKIALVDERDLSWVAQARPGQFIRFELAS